jgi:photosystem II stability/assembly factor-like uncharacterized protein
MNSGEYIFDMEQLTPTRFIFSEAFKLYEYNIETEQIQTYTDPNFQNITRISFVDSLLGYALKVPLGILRTTDGGLTWTVINANHGAIFGQIDILFIDSLTGYFTRTGSGSFSQKTNDGGVTWNNVIITGQNFNGQNFGGSNIYIKENEIYIVGSGAYIHSSDGVNWDHYMISTLSNGTYKSIFKSLNGDLLACGMGFNGSINIGLIAKSMDNGQNWEVKEFPSINRFNDIEMVTELVGYAVGKSQGQINCIYKTIDGGESWHPQNFSTLPAFSPELLNIHCINEDTCFASGNPGTILMTTNGGGLFADLSVLENVVSFFKVYPNPFENIISIKSEVKVKNIYIIDEVGRIIYSESAPDSNTISIDLKSYSSGIYFIKLETENNTEIQKIVKK